MIDSDVNSLLAPTITRLVRGSTTAVAATSALVLVADVAVGGFDGLRGVGDAASWSLRAVAIASLALALLTRRVDVGRAVRTGEGWAIIAFHPLLVGCMVASLTPLFPQASVLSLALLLIVHVAGLISGRTIARATLLLQAGATLWAHVLVPSPDPRWTVVVLVVGAAAAWTSRTAVTVMLDSIERHEAALAHVERVAQARQDFVATVSHELRTPIHVVSGMAETLDERWDQLASDQRHELVRRLRSSGDSLRTLVEGLLDFARLGAETVELRPEIFDLGSITDEVVRANASAHPDHVIRLSGGVTGQVVADPLLVERVVDNLVRNACNHTPAGTTVTVVTSHAGHELQVEVVDDGPGIASEDLPRLTERFFRGGDHLSRDAGGVGLGLAFCADVLQLHGRSLEVVSEPGQGARFAFRLPVAEAPSRSPVEVD